MINIDQCRFIDRDFVKNLYKELKGLKLGMEYESGYNIVSYAVGNYNKVLERIGVDRSTDPSLRYADNIEYKTSIIEGLNGANNLLVFLTLIDLGNIVNYIRNHEDPNNNTRYTPPTTGGTHIHISSPDMDREFMCALYVLMCRLQIDIINIINVFNVYAKVYGLKSCDYSQMLPSIYIDLVGKPINEIVGTLTNRIKALFKGNPIYEHSKKGSKVKLSSRVNTRYRTLNFYTAYKTVEFRLFNNVPSFRILLSWILISVYIYRYAQRNSKFILSHLHFKKITVDDIIRSEAKTVLGEFVLNEIKRLRQVSVQASFKSQYNIESGERHANYADSIMHIKKKNEKKSTTEEE